MMSHLIKIYTVCKFSYFHLWYLKSLSLYMPPSSVCITILASPTSLQIWLWLRLTAFLGSGHAGGGRGGERGGQKKEVKQF